MNDVSLLFGEFLVAKGLVDEDVLMVALDIQRQSRRPLGQIALQTGLITKKDLLKILTEQRKELPLDKSFGLIALELGILTTDQVDSLVASQSESNAMLGEILVGQDRLTKAQLTQSLQEFYDQETP